MYVDKKSGPWILASAKFLFGTLAISLKLIPASIIVLAFAMHFFGAIGSLPKAYPELKQLTKKQLIKISSLGLALVITDVSYFYAIRVMDVSVSTLLRWVAPVLLGIGVFVTTRQTNNYRAVIATVTAFIGLGLVLSGQGFDFGTANFYGVAAAFISAASVAVYWYSSKRVLHNISPMTVLFLRSMAACLVLLPFIGWQGLGSSWWPVILFGFVYGFFASYLDTIGIQRTPIILVGLIGYIVPLTSVFGATVLLGETISPIMAIGGLIVLASGLWAQRT